MLRIQPGKFYQINNSDKKSSANDHYNMIVVEDNEGEIQELLFTDSDLVKATIRRRKNGEDIPCYKLAVAEAGFVYVIGLTMFGVVGSFIGYFIKGLGLL